MSAPDLNALIGSRICHDLISPLGAIGNGVELLNMAGNVAGPELSLITGAVGNANARIRFFRVAFGAAGPGAMMGRAEILSILDGVYHGGRLSVAWSAPGDQPRRLVRLGFLIVQCLEAMLPWGGTITVTAEGDTWRFAGAGARIKRDDALWALVMGGARPEDLAAADVHFALVPAAAEDAGRQVSFQATETGMIVSF